MKSSRCHDAALSIGLIRMGLSFPATPLRLSAAVAMLIAAGCGTADPTATVVGKISYNGKTVDKGTVMFTPRSGMTVTGKLESGGIFRLLNPRSEQNIPPAEYSVVVITDTSDMAQRSEDPMALGAIKPTIPMAFSSAATTPLKLEVKEGENSFDINLDQYEKAAQR